MSEQTVGMVAVELPEPSEYPTEGEAQWNIYPFVRISNSEIHLGATSEHVYVINASEARGVAATLLAAAARLTEVTP